MRENDWTKVLGWPGYKVYRAEIDERAKRLKLWVRRKRGNKQLVCSGCGHLVGAIAETYEREVRDLPWSEYLTTVVVELYRLRCPDCGVKAEKVPQLPSKAPFSKRFEDAVGLACESASARRVAFQFGLSTNAVRAIDLRYLQRWQESRKKPALRNMGVDEIHLGKKLKFITVVSNLDAAEGAMLRYLNNWINQLRWQRLKPMEKLANMLVNHLEGILNYCRTKVKLGVVEAVNGNIKALLRRGRGYRNLNYLLLKAQRL
jgi:transposase